MKRAFHGETVAGVNYSRRRFLTSLIASATSISALSAWAQVDRFSRPKLQPKLQPGDIIFVDLGNAIEGGFVVKVDPNTGEKTVLSSGGLLQNPFGVAVAADGQLIVSDSGRLIGIDSETSSQSIIVDNPGGHLGQPYGLIVEHPGSLIVANLKEVLRVNFSSNRIQTICTGGNLLYPLDVARTSRNELLVLNMAFPPQIIRVGPNGEQSVLTQGGLLKAPQAMAILNDKIYVTDVATADGNFGVGRIIEIDAQSGTQTIAVEGEYLSGPVGIAATESGQLIIADPYTARESSGEFDGGIMRIDPVIRKQTLITLGEGAFVNPRGVAIIPN
jgi:DNA-binding beta-propeller fold protein YncE